MAIVRAIASGNWSNTAIWNTGALPTSADDVYSNTFTVTIDISPTVLRISNAATTGVTVGGGFTMSAGGLTLTANVIAGTTAPCLTVSVGAGSSANVIGNLTGPTASASGATALVFSGTGTLNVTGSVTGAPSTGGANHGISATSGGNLNITGSVVGSTGSSTNYGINGNAVNLTVTGDITAGTSSSAVFSSNAGFALNHTGNATALNNVAAIYSSSTSASVIVTGPFLVSANGTHAIFCPNWRWSSATPVSYYQVRTAVSGAIRTLFTADSVAGVPAASNVRSGTVYGPASELTGTCAVPAAGSVALGVPVDNTSGTAVLTAANVQTALTSQGFTTTRAGYLDNISTAAPSAATIAAAVWASLTSGLSTVGSIGKLLVDQLDAAISTRSTYAGGDTSGTTTLLSRLSSGRAGNLDNLDATVSSRLASANYQAPLDAAGTRSAVGLATGNLDTQLSGLSSGISGLPSAAAIASAVWSAATRTLTTAIDNSSTIAAAVWNYATGRTITGGTVDTLVNSPSVPSAAAIASQVRTELTPELARVSNAATTQEVADIVEGAVDA